MDWYCELADLSMHLRSLAGWGMRKDHSTAAARVRA